jgi:uncharacterized protein YrrD
MKPIWAKEMLGTPVRARSGDELGEIEDFVFDRQLRTVKSAIIVRRGLLKGSESFRLPLVSLALDTENECFVVATGEEPQPIG